MDFDATLTTDDGVATIRLVGELDSHGAPRLNDLVTEAAEAEPTRLVLLMKELSYMSSSGLRSLIVAHQKLPEGTDIVLVGTQPDVAETIKLTGFDRSVTMQESADV